MTASNEVFFPRNNDYDNWKSDVADYQMKRTNFQGVPEKVNHVKEHTMKKIETEYNPILQKYNDNNQENNARVNEQENFIKTLAANKDRALRYEQTYNVLNFENKLAGLENRPDYPKEKPWYFRPERDSMVDYNIVSNLSLQQHYFDAPDKRPQCEPFNVSINFESSNSFILAKIPNEKCH